MTASDEEEPMTATLQPPDLDRQQDLTVDDLASLPEDLRYELIDGRLILSSPSLVHQHIVPRMCAALEINCPPDLVVAIDMSLEIDHRNEPRPDIVVAGMDHADDIPLPVVDVVLAVEIISPTSRSRDTFAKLRTYAKARVANYWIVDPLAEAGIVLSEHRFSGGRNYGLVTTTDKVFATEEPYPITIDLPALTARRDAILKRAHAKR
jgi:Uma2 family endonuclease